MSERENLGEILVRLRTRVDEHFAKAVERSPEAINCGAGCWECCRPRFSVFEVEAAPIRHTLAEIEQRDPALRERIRRQGHDAELGHCALLVDGRCSVYDQRPMICRSHGLAIGFESEDDPDEVFVDHCPLNYRDEPPPPASVLMLESVNRPLAMLASLWSAGNRVSLAELARGRPE